jgi:hypothetical protein
MFSLLRIYSLSILLCGCATWDTSEIEPTSLELERAGKVHFYGPANPVVFDRCQLLGEMKLNEMESGQPPSVVAVRKYPEANYVVHINSRTDGGVNGEFAAGFYLVLDCGIFK